MKWSKRENQNRCIKARRGGFYVSGLDDRTKRRKGRTFLALFDSNGSDAKKRYREFVRKGVEMGKRPDLTGGGLLRSQGGWAGVKVNLRAGDYQKGDQRILGDGDFVNEVLAQARERMENQYRLAAEGFDFEKLLNRVSQITQLEPNQLLDSKGTGPGRMPGAYCVTGPQTNWG